MDNNFLVEKEKINKLPGVISSWVILLLQVVLIFILGYLLSLGNPGVWDDNQTPGFLFSALTYYLFPAIGIIGIIAAINSFRKKRLYFISTILLIVSLLVAPWYPAVRISQKIAGIFNPAWVNFKTVGQQMKEVKKYNEGNEEMARAHYKYFQNIFSQPQTITKNQYYQGSFDIGNGITIYPVKGTILSGMANEEEKAFYEKQIKVLNEINGQQVEIKLPPYEIFKQYYLLDSRVILQSTPETLAQYNDPTNEVWRKPITDPSSGITIPSFPPSVPVYIYYQGRFINDELQCKLQSCL
jgi:hypothetical protein